MGTPGGVAGVWGGVKQTSGNAAIDLPLPALQAISRPLAYTSLLNVTPHRIHALPAIRRCSDSGILLCAREQSPLPRSRRSHVEESPVWHHQVELERRCGSLSLLACAKHLVQRFRVDGLSAEVPHIRSEGAAIPD